MKRIIAFFMAFCMLLSVGAFAVNFELSVYVDGQRVQFPDAKQFKDSNNRTLVPVRFVSEALNANVEWNGELRQVTVTKDSKKIVLTINKQEMQINGVTKTLDCAPLIVEDRTFVPIRFVSEALDAVVEWDGKVRTVYISTKKKEEEKKAKTIGGTEEQPFEVDVNDADIVNGDSYIAKDSGMGFDCSVRGDQVLTVSFYNRDGDNISVANKEAIDVLSQQLSAETISSVKAILDDCANNKDHFTYDVIDESNYSLAIMATYKNYTIYVYKNA